MGSALMLVGCAAERPASSGSEPSSALASSSSAEPTTTPGVTNDSKAGAALLEAMQAGGVVLYLRHPATDRGGTDSAALPREQQRLLSALGEQQAAELGQSFTRHGIGTEDVLTSPLWRCQDAARIAFGDYRVEPLLEGLLAEVSGNTDEARINFSLELLRKAVPDGQVRVLVGHTSNILQTTGVRIEEASGVLVRPDGQSSFTVLGTLTAADWAAWAKG